MTDWTDKALQAWNEKQQGLAPRITRDANGDLTKEGEGIIVRLDKYNLSVDGVRIPATPEQEQRIRSLSDEARVRFMAIMRGKMPEAFDPRPPEPEVVEVTYYGGKTITRYSDGTQRMSMDSPMIAAAGWCAPSEMIHDMGFTVEEPMTPQVTALEALEQMADHYRNQYRRQTFFAAD